MPIENVLAIDDERPPARWMPVYEGLRDAIVGHLLAPGRKLPEDELCAIYRVGRSVVRAALQALAHDGLVRAERNRGAFVAQPSPREAREVFEARALIEPQVAAMAAARADAHVVETLRAHLAREEQALAEGHDSEAIMLSAKFHVAVAHVADQQVLKELVRDLVSRSSLIIALYWQRRDTTCQSQAHLALVDALAAGEGERAARLMAEHLHDLLAGLDLGGSTEAPRDLADILQPP